MGKATKIFLVFAVIATLAFISWGVVRSVQAIQFETNCMQYLKRAADASTVETAKKELGKAISYAEENNLTDGIVSIFLHQPKNDVGFWYTNMKEAYSELENLSEDASSLEKTNVLMKLRETLTDEEESGNSVTVPEGIDVYPNNISYFCWGWGTFLLAIVLWVMTGVSHLEDWD